MITKGIVYEVGRDLPVRVRTQAGLSACVHVQAGGVSPARRPACRSRFGTGGRVCADAVALPPVYRQMVLTL